MSDVFNVFLSDTVMHLCSNCNRRTINVLMMMMMMMMMTEM